LSDLLYEVPRALGGAVASLPPNKHKAHSANLLSDLK
jgi:hypothetical protein